MHFWAFEILKCYLNWISENQGFHQQFCCLLKFSKISKNQQKNVCWFLLRKTAKRMPTMIFWWNNSLFKGKFQNSINIFLYFSSLILTNWFFYLNSKIFCYSMSSLLFKLLNCILWFLWRIFEKSNDWEDS